jgi:hypothetical protein
MKKTFASVFIAATAFVSLQGCMAETGADESVSESGLSACTNPEGTNAATAALATAIAQELHRFQFATDFEVYTGYNNQGMLRLTQAGKNACGGSCPKVESLLSLQDSRMDGQAVFGGVKLSSWSFASRLVTGHGNMKTCQNTWCKYPAHTFEYGPGAVVTSPGVCGLNYTFKVKKPASMGGGTLTETEIAQLKNALTWTNANGFNEWIDFQNTDSTISIDPGGNMNPPGQVTGTEICQTNDEALINAVPAITCTCAAFSPPVTNGVLKKDKPLTPRIAYCRQVL